MPSLDPKHLRLALDKQRMWAQLVMSAEAAEAYAPDQLDDLLAFVAGLGLAEPDLAAVRAWAAEGKFGTPVQVATGTLPAHGEDGRIDYVFERELRAAAAEAAADAQIDYKEWSHVKTVRAGQLLARVIPPGRGTPGCDVFGQEVLAKPGRLVKLEAGKNVVLEEGGAAARSTIDGLVSYRGRRIDVSPVYRVPNNVDLTVGNVRFNGDVLVEGNVLEGFVVEATGNIEVRQNVDKGALLAGGNVVVDGQVYGKEDIWVRAGGDVRVRNAENANLEAEGDVFVIQDAIQSHIVARRAFVGHETEGHIRGGVVETTAGIVVGVVGSPGVSANTHLEIKWEQGLIRQMMEFKEERVKAQQERDEVERQLLHLRRMAERSGPLPAPQQQRVKELEAAAHTSRERETELHFQREELAERIEQSRRSTIEVRGGVHPDAVIIIHGKSQSIHEQRGPLVAKADPDRLRIMDVVGTSS